MRDSPSGSRSLILPRKGARLLLFPPLRHPAIGPSADDLCVGRKGPDWRGCKRKENTMSRTFTLQDLRTKSLPELCALRGALLRDLDRHQPYSADAKHILANIAVVNLAIRQRTPGGPRF